MNTRMLSLKRCTAVAFAGLVAAAGVIAPAAPASAAPSLDLYCIPLGQARGECQLTITGGVAPYSTTWQRGANAGPFVYTSTEWAVAKCNLPYRYTTVGATVTDATSSSAQVTTTFYCGDAA